MIVRCAAQPSHDRATAIPLADFDVNAVGRVNLLEATRVGPLTLEIEREREGSRRCWPIRRRR